MTEKWAFLTQIEDDREADVIESMFGFYGIPLLRKYRWAGGFLKVFMGVSSFGVDLYVPESVLNISREILEAKQEQTSEEESRG
ncbi:MAG: hypothetical protein QHH10_10525 [Peptococcaceae bacterium]|jgi:hypothetical protein|nr:hypothetical protein [Peptococcaceae bacterium]MDH7525732.1 hypothetical protein [Peptococcaceae bacterium]